MGSVFNEFLAVNSVLNEIPDNSALHLGNSMSVRYANLVGLNSSRRVEVFSNRGTAGIDGSMSTAVGHALQSDKIQTLIIGDISFFYDRNALWLEKVPNNLRIVLLNNHGGGIFKLIDGPEKLPEVDEYFVSKQKLQAQSTAKEMGLDYFYCNDLISLYDQLKLFFEKNDKAKILEIDTDIEINTQVFSFYKKTLKNICLNRT